MVNRYPYPSGQVHLSGQPVANAVVSAMELFVAGVVVLGIVVAYEYSQRRSR